MIVCAAGDTHGALDRLFADVLDFEAHADDFLIGIGPQTGVYSGTPRPFPGSRTNCASLRPPSCPS